MESARRAKFTRDARPPERHRHAADGGHARRDGGGRGGRRRLRRGPDGARARERGGRAHGQGGRALRAERHDGQSARDCDADAAAATRSSSAKGRTRCFTRSAPAAVLSGVQFIVAGAGGFFSVEELHASSSRTPTTTRARRSSRSRTPTTARAGACWPSARRARRRRRGARTRARACTSTGRAIWNASVAQRAHPSDDLAAPLRHRQRVLLEGARRARRERALRGTRARRTRRGASARCGAAGCGRRGSSAAGARYALDHHRATPRRRPRQRARFAERCSGRRRRARRSRLGRDEHRQHRPRSSPPRRRRREGGPRARPSLEPHGCSAAAGGHTHGRYPRGHPRRRRAARVGDSSRLISPAHVGWRAAVRN